MSQSCDALLKMVDTVKRGISEQKRLVASWDQPIAGGYQPTSGIDPDSPPRGVSGVPSLAPVDTSLQALRCPNCGAPLNARERSPYICAYCRCTIVVGGFIPPRPAEHVVLLKPDENIPTRTILA